MEWWLNIFSGVDIYQVLSIFLASLLTVGTIFAFRNSLSIVLNVEMKTVPSGGGEFSYSYLEVHIFNGGPGAAKNIVWTIRTAEDKVEEGFIPLLMATADHVVKALPMSANDGQKDQWKYQVEVAKLKFTRRKSKINGFRFTRDGAMIHYYKKNRSGRTMDIWKRER